ncbi:hypothetical protein GW17_00050571 [Ensete ventricosum]|nr:hypothetical protein GW17_00050571 [Ensete ventricosum]
MGFYSNGYEAPVPEVLTTHVTYHAVVLRHSFHGPHGEVHGVPPATKEGRSCPPYLCQVGRMTADPPMLASGRAQSRRVGHVVGPNVRGRKDMADKLSGCRDDCPRSPWADTSRRIARDDVVIHVVLRLPSRIRFCLPRRHQWRVSNQTTVCSGVTATVLTHRNSSRPAGEEARKPDDSPPGAIMLMNHLREFHELSHPTGKDSIPSLVMN